LPQPRRFSQSGSIVMLQFLRPSAKGGVACVLLVALQLGACSSQEQRAQVYYDDGTKLLARHEDQKATIQFKNAIRLKPNLVAAWRGLAQIEERNEHWGSAIPILQMVVKLDPQEIDARWKLGRLLLLGGAGEQAAKLVNDADEPANRSAKIRGLKAAILFKLNDKSGAVREAQAALEIDPGDVDATLVLAEDRLDNDDAKGALKILANLAIASTNDIGPQPFVGDVLAHLTDREQMEAVLRKLKELFPKEAAFRKYLVKYYLDQRRPDEAESELRSLLAADPADSEVGLNLVRLVYATKGAAAARAELAGLISTRKVSFPYEMALADLDIAQGKFADASKLLETLANDEGAPEHSLAAKIKLAELNLNRKNFDAADAGVAGILRVDAQNADALRIRGTIRMERGQPEAAISDLTSALHDRPRSIPLMLLLATAYERSGAINLAEGKYADAMRVSDSNPAVALNYVAFLLRRGNTEHADAILTELAARRPDNASILSALAEVKLNLKDWLGAEEISEKIRRLGNSRGVADEILGASLSGQAKYDESVKAFQEAMAAEPAATLPMVSVVRTLLQARQPEKAVAFLQTVLKTNPENAEAYVLLGTVYAANNEPDQAIKSFTAAIEKRPKDVGGYRALADLYLAQNKINAAVQTIRGGLDQQPDSVLLHLTLASIFERAEDYEKAIGEYEYVLSQQPGSLIAANNLASLLADHRADNASVERALAIAAGLQQSPVPQFMDTLGWVNYRRGNFKAATPLLEKAVAALPNLALPHYHLGMAYVALREDTKAAKEFEAALKNDPSNELKVAIEVELGKLKERQ
jgi:cellulose synthase operon protein C